MLSPPPLDPRLFNRLVELRRDLHRHPELGWQEHRTAGKICDFLDGLGVAYRREVAQTGVVAEIPGRRDGPCVALRADMDALPIIEETGLPFASEVSGVMHACGHDGHTTMLLGAAALLAREEQPLVTVRLIFQPAEETGQGAKAMIAAGALENVAMIFGGHIDRHFPLGSVVVTDGPVNASSDTFSIRITGRGGHAARPHETVDAVVAGSLLVSALQTIVSREVNPAHPSVVTVGRFEAGTAANVIAGQAQLKGSIRSQDQDVRLSLHRAIERIAKSIGELHGAATDVRIKLGTSPVVNPRGATSLARRAATDVVEEENVLKMVTANMGGEDFSYYLDQIPGCYVRFGMAHDGVCHFPAHSSRFDFDEHVIAVGAAYYHVLAITAGEAVADGRTDSLG
ncbi:MAG: peptidase M20 [Planctomycetaceae bacterium]|nr:peptidase M20 [Planctomycetaceae bacterium]